MLVVLEVHDGEFAEEGVVVLERERILPRQTAWVDIRRVDEPALNAVKACERALQTPNAPFALLEHVELATRRRAHGLAACLE